MNLHIWLERDTRRWHVAHLAHRYAPHAADLKTYIMVVFRQQVRGAVCGHTFHPQRLDHASSFLPLHPAPSHSRQATIDAIVSGVLCVGGGRGL